MNNMGGAREGAGRPKGSKNKRTRLLDARLAELDCPFESLQRVGLKAEKDKDYATAAKCFSELASYMKAKPKPVEEVKRPGNVFTGMTLERLQEIKQGILDGDIQPEELGFGGETVN